MRDPSAGRRATKALPLAALRKVLQTGALLGAMAGGLLPAGGLTVIVNPELPVYEISVEELRAVFLGTKTSLKGTGTVQPVLNQSGPALAEFSSQYLGKSESALRSYYRSLVFTGKWSMPVTLDTDAEMVAYVARTRNAIGFIVGASADQGVRTLKVR